jgi:hypothetical protein
MAELGSIVEKVRSKNAGPFWLTIDIFCGSRQVFDQVRLSLSNARVAAAFQMDPGLVKRFDIQSLNVVKFSFPRPVVQGTRQDRDMHGASWAVLLSEMQIN